MKKNRIKYWREERLLTQAELGRKIKMSQSNLARLEAGTYSPSLKTLVKLSKALEVEIKELIQ
jgi:transcriptional regulator with XRE-family HTH domain